jgi:hypothetical protein
LLAMDKLMPLIQSSSVNCIDKWQEQVANMIVTMRCASIHKTTKARK